MSPKSSCCLIGTMLCLIFPLFLSIPSWAEDPEPAIPFEEDEEWASDLATAQLSQIGSGKSMLLLIWARRDKEVERLERDLKRWRGVPELLESFCKVHLRVDRNRKVVSDLGVSRAPCFVLVGSDISRDLGDRVIGILEETGDSEALVSFLRQGLSVELSSLSLFDIEPLSGAQETNTLEQAELAEKEGNSFEALRLLEEFNETIPSSSPELKKSILLRLADLSYGLGDLVNAESYYRKAAAGLVDSDTRTEALHILYQLALLLNDSGQNEEAAEAIRKRVEKESDPEEKKRLEEIRAAIETGLFVLAELGYPGVGARLVGGGGATPEDLGDSDLSFEERIEKADTDLNLLRDSLNKWFRQTGKYPDYLEDLPEEDLPEEGLPRDPFLEGSEYRYLHYEEPEDFLLYSIGPDGEDQFGDREYDPSEGKGGKGDIVRRP